MKFYTEIISKKNLNGQIFRSRMSIKGLKPIEDILPTEKEFTLWVRETVDKMLTYDSNIDLIHIKVIPEVYIEIVKSLYKKIGKNVELYDKDRSSTYFKIPSQKDKAFYEDILRIVLYNEELRCATIVIHI